MSECMCECVCSCDTLSLVASVCCLITAFSFSSCCKRSLLFAYSAHCVMHECVSVYVCVCVGVSECVVVAVLQVK